MFKKIRDIAEVLQQTNTLEDTNAIIRDHAEGKQTEDQAIALSAAQQLAPVTEAIASLKKELTPDTTPETGFGEKLMKSIKNNRSTSSCELTFDSKITKCTIGSKKIPVDEAKLKKGIVSIQGYNEIQVTSNGLIALLCYPQKQFEAQVKAYPTLIRDEDIVSYRYIMSGIEVTKTIKSKILSASSDADGISYFKRVYLHHGKRGRHTSPVSAPVSAPVEESKGEVAATDPYVGDPSATEAMYPSAATDGSTTEGSAREGSGLQPPVIPGEGFHKSAKRLRILSGEIAAGNQSKAIKKEFLHLLDAFYKHGHISPENYRNTKNGHLGN